MAPRISENTQRHLEWDLIRHHLSRECQCAEGVRRAKTLSFATSFESLLERQARTNEARLMLDQGIVLTVGQLEDVRGELSHAKRSGLLDPEALVAIGRLLETSRRVRDLLSSTATAPTLQEYIIPLFVAEPLEKELLEIFDESFQLVNGASPKLRQLRRQTQELHTNLRDTLNRYLSDEDILPMLQEDYFTLRDERYVLPMKARHKNHLEGIVHGWSKTGATVYLEPSSVIEANNRLMLAQAEADAEVNRILRALSKSVGMIASELHATFERLAELDVVCAMARFSQRLDAHPPEINQQHSLKLTAFRHPLLVLGQPTVVSNSVHLTPANPVLVVTGPNTGGKTVVLKSVGLLVLMAYAGMHIPAAAGSSLPFSSGVFSDIGDAQSLQSKHSTFSGHIDNLKTIIEHASTGSIVLLDELVVGTDPAQGSALAQAITEHFASNGCLLVVTTHYENLKCLALEDQRFRNGAMGLRGDSALPTYTLTLDVPGASSALMTARRLGLADGIVNRATQLIDPAERAVQKQLQRLDEIQAALETQKREFDSKMYVINEREAKLKAREAKLEAQIAKLRDKAHQELLRDAQNLRDSVQKKSKALKRIRVMDQDTLDEAKRSAEAAIKHVFDQRRSAATDKAGPALDPARLRIGQTVYVLSIQRKATLEFIDLHRSRCKVRAGMLSVQAKLSDLRATEPSTTTVQETPVNPIPRNKRVRTAEQKPPNNEDLWAQAAPQSSANTIDVRGKTVDESLEFVAKFLDTCYLRNERTVFIIHGHGGGHLKRAIRSWLTTSNYALDQRRGDRYEGGDGVTVVQLIDA